jgi:tetratricopeptide (TPR) repeat protein
LRLVNTITRAYQNLRLLTEARAASESVMPGIETLGAEGAPTLLTLAHTYYLQGKFKEATDTVQRAERMLGPDVSSHPESRGYAAELMAEIDADGSMQPTKAIGESDRALRIYEGIPNIDPRTVARVLSNRGLVLSAMGDYDDAKVALMRANTLLRKTFGDNHLTVGQSFEGLAENAQNAGKFV